jgi:uncharacterized protein YeaO (DUF488 family)
MTTDTPRTDAVPSTQSVLTAQSDPVKLLDACVEYREQLDESKAEVERLKEAMISCLHITNCYDGNYTAACDNVEIIVRNALISLTPDKTNQ